MMNKTDEKNEVYEEWQNKQRLQWKMEMKLH